MYAFESRLLFCPATSCRVKRYALSIENGFVLSKWPRADEYSYILLDSMYICAYNSHVNYQWDPEKAKSNRKKHGVSFADAVAVFSDEFALTVEDESSEEQRFVTMGMDVVGRLILVVYTWRGNNIRLISARKATAGERKEYKERR
jgi:uncharacterized DUF497 family protein